EKAPSGGVVVVARRAAVAGLLTEVEGLPERRMGLDADGRVAALAGGILHRLEQRTASGPAEGSTRISIDGSRGTGAAYRQGPPPPPANVMMSPGRGSWSARRRGGLGGTMRGRARFGTLASSLRRSKT